MSDSLASAITTLAQDISRGSFRSEADISQGVVKRILQELKWPVFDVQIVAPEFKIGSRSVDYALCHPAGRPVVLLEVKALGKARLQGRRQLFEYCFHQGVPIAVLTDGRTWSLFLPAGRGSYEERRFARVDLVKDDGIDCATSLGKYLDFEAVRSGDAQRQAWRDYEADRSQEDAAAEYASVWRRLLSRPETPLLNLFSEEVETATGVSPDQKRVAAFIREQAEMDTLSPVVGTQPTKATEGQHELVSQRPRPTSNSSERSSPNSAEHYLKFWSAFQRRVEATADKLQPRRPQSTYYTNYPIGRSYFKLTAIASLRRAELRVELSVEGRDGHRNFDALEECRQDIEAELTFSVIWKPRAGKQRCRIYVQQAANLRSRKDWPEYHDWLLNHLLAFDRVFRPRIARL